jgi:transposase
MAKSVFQIHGATMTGQVLFRKKLSRGQLLRFMGSQPACVVVMEACSSAHYWARELIMLGHEVKLIAPQYVRPFVKRQKNDVVDAEAIVIAAQRPEMRFVEPKSPEQQARAILFRARERIVHQRTELVNALRAVLYEYGHVVPLGLGHIKRIEAIVDDADVALPELVQLEGSAADSTSATVMTAGTKKQSSWADACYARPAWCGHRRTPAKSLTAEISARCPTGSRASSRQATDQGPTEGR